MSVQIIDRQRILRTDKKLIRDITEQLLAFLGIKNKTLNILFTDDNGIREFNRKFLNRDTPTNVISFSYLEDDSKAEFPDEQIMGDIIISLERTWYEAKKAGCSLNERLFSLIIHGVLHIIGYDHEKDASERRRMRYMEKKLERFIKSLPLYGKLSELGEKKNNP